MTRQDWEAIRANCLVEAGQWLILEGRPSWGMFPLCVNSRWPWWQEELDLHLVGAFRVTQAWTWEQVNEQFSRRILRGEP